LNFLLDTNACIAVINGRPEAVGLRLQKELEGGAQVLVPAIVAFELWYGVAKSRRREENSRRVSLFFAGPVHLLPFEAEDAQSAGRLRAALEALGKPLGAYDLLIAGQALRRRLRLVTSNTSEFARVEALAWEDWAAR